MALETDTFDTDLDAENVSVRLALGRVFRILSRMYQGKVDDEQYEMCRRLILDVADRDGAVQSTATQGIINWARDRGKGQQGDG